MVYVDELINYLGNIKEEHGNIPVFVEGDTIMGYFMECINFDISEIREVCCPCSEECRKAGKVKALIL